MPLEIILKVAAQKGMEVKYTSIKIKLFMHVLKIGIVIIFCFNFLGVSSQNQVGLTEDKNQLPNVLSDQKLDLIALSLKFQAGQYFALQQLPEKKEDWEIYRKSLKHEIIGKTGMVINHDLPFNTIETGEVKMSGYSIKKIAFQTRPGIYATANLYVPDGNGRFPGIIVMMGHSSLGKLYDKYQSVGHTLALNGYVSLCIDPWGSGERSTVHGKFEDHGDENNLGSSLMNIGESLMGMQITDNIRGVDLLCSLPYVDSTKIGATGSSGGGNQTMWLAAMDERVKAAVPVVSSGTFESYIMGSPCICEVLPSGLTFTEEAGILALVAPRAIKMCNHQQDNNSAFYPSEMLRSYKNARPVFEMFGIGNNISYQIFDLPHGYYKEDRETMLGWFDLHLKGIGNGLQKNEIPFETLPLEKLMVFPEGKRNPQVLTTETYCKQKGTELRSALFSTKTIDIEAKKNELRDLLCISSKSVIKTIHEFPDKNGWNRFALETFDDKLIPVLLKLSPGKSKEFIIVCSSDGKNNISPDLIQETIKSGKGIVLVDLSGTGELTSTSSSFDINGNLRTMSRSLLWFGKTVIGEWVKELNTVAEFLHTNFNAEKIQIDGSKEAGLAALFQGALENNIDTIVLRSAPISYLFDTSESINFFGMGIHLPGFLKWGDVSLAAAISGKSILFIDPVTMSGQKLNESRLIEYEVEYEKLRAICKQPGKTLFNQTSVYNEH